MEIVGIGWGVREGAVTVVCQRASGRRSVNAESQCVAVNVESLDRIHPLALIGGLRLRDHFTSGSVILR